MCAVFSSAGPSTFNEGQDWMNQKIEFEVEGVALTVLPLSTLSSGLANGVYEQAHQDAIRAGRLTEDQAERNRTDWHERRDELWASIRDKENELAQPSISPSDRRQVATLLREDRTALRRLLEDPARPITAEGLALQARLESLIVSSVVFRGTQRSVFSSIDEYQRRADEPFAYMVAKAVGKAFFGLTEHPEDEVLRTVVAAA